MTTHYINGKWIEGEGNPFHSFNPATGTEIWKGKHATANEVHLAVEAAAAAFPAWSALPLDARIQHLKTYENKLKENLEHLATTISEENGKPLWEARTEVQAMIGKIAISIDAHATRCAERKKETGGMTYITHHKPHGPLAIFGPFNFPGHLPNGHIVPALLAGNTIILKNSHFTPKVAQEIVKLWDLPPGVLNLVQGGDETGKALSTHPGIEGLFFTGSVKTGQLLASTFPAHKILALEMGGNNPLVVDEIDDLDAAAYITLQSAYLTAGQRCTCARRLIVVDNLPFVEKLQALIKTIEIGPYTQTPEPFMGPLITPESGRRLLDAQAHLIDLGGKPLIEMQHIPPAFVTPGLIDVTSIKELPDREYFGPLLQVIHVPTFEKAVEEANKTTYGLSAGLLSTNADHYTTFLNTVRAGIINWNTQITGASSNAPFGGIGASGNHRPSAYYAADYCAYPVASIESVILKLPANLPPGVLHTQPLQP